MKHLCDVNFWVALILGNHPHHEVARDWFGQLGERDSLFFCRVTQQGFLRLVSDSGIFGLAAIPNRKAWEAYRTLLSHSKIEWREEPSELESRWIDAAAVPRCSPKIWMDAYLAAFATLTQSRLVTFDKGFRVYKGLDWIDLNSI